MGDLKKYIESDIESGISYMRAGLMNALSKVRNKEVEYLEFEKHIPFSLIKECCENTFGNVTVSQINSDTRFIDIPEYNITVACYVSSGQVIISYYKYD